jgi:hypothetical protein
MSLRKKSRPYTINSVSCLVSSTLISAFPESSSLLLYDPEWIIDGDDRALETPAALEFARHCSRYRVYCIIACIQEFSSIPLVAITVRITIVPPTSRASVLRISARPLHAGTISRSIAKVSFIFDLRCRSIIRWLFFLRTSLASNFDL